tara:strand:+ start:291 stop:524 length:234 start_codon:yes stop_codon:yes gene_type:complete
MKVYDLEINKEDLDRKFKKFARRHGLKPSEVGHHESRTMDYKVDFPHKKRRTAEVRKRYGTPDYVKRKYCERINNHN